jgi:hypothetical protein
MSHGGAASPWNARPSRSFPTPGSLSDWNKTKQARCSPRGMRVGVWFQSSGWNEVRSHAQSPGSSGWTPLTCAKECAAQKRCLYWTVQLSESRECHLFARRLGPQQTKADVVHGSCKSAMHGGVFSGRQRELCPVLEATGAPPPRLVTATPTALPVYVIHVARAHARWQRMVQQLAQAGISRYSIIRAVTLDAVDDECRQHQITLARSFGKRDAAVALSHLRALRRLTADGVSAALILEDDVLLTSRLPEKLARVLVGAPPFDVFFAGWYSHLTARHCVCPVPGRPDLRTLHSDGIWGQQWWGTGPCINTGLNGYVASVSGAHRMLRMMATMHSTIDTQLGDAASGPSPLRLLAAWPPKRLVTHNFSIPSIRVPGAPVAVRTGHTK